MSKLLRVYEWSVIALSVAVLILTAGGIWFGFLDGQVVNVPIKFNDPHVFAYPATDHAERPAREITHLTTKNSFRPGEMVTAYVDIVKYRKEPGVLQWQLMDQRFYPYVRRNGVIPLGHHHMIVEIEKIPLHVPPGQFHFSGTVTYKVNFLRDIHIPIKTNCFQVVDK
jgi:hypothetical protein